MCGGFVGDILDGIGDIIEDVGDAIGDAVESVVDNPIGVLTSVALLSMGVPPVYAGAISGGVNAAANGGNVLEGALLGGAMAGAGGYASNWAGASGLSTTAQAAAAGAAAGATGALLTGQGLSNVITGAVSGGLMGGAIAYIQKPNGTITYTYDDGSTLTRNVDGTYSSTPSNTVLAPVVDRSIQSTGEGTINLSSSWAGRDIGGAPAGTVWTGEAGPEIVLNDGKVLPLDVYRAAIATGEPIYVDGVRIDQNFENIARAQANLNNTEGVIDVYRTPGTALASVEEINTGKAYYNDRAHAWETTQVNDTNASSVYNPQPQGPIDPNTISGRNVINIQSTGLSDSAPGTIYQGPNGPEIVLNSGKTVLLEQYEMALGTNSPVAVDGGMQTQFRVEVTGGLPQYEGMPGAATAPEGYRVARPEDVFGPDDSRNAANPFKPGTYIDRETNTWFTPLEAPTLTPLPIDPTNPVGPSFPSAPDQPLTYYNPNTGQYEVIQPVELPTTPVTPVTPVIPAEGQTTIFDDGTWITVMPDGSTTGIDTSGSPFVRGPSTGVTPGTGGAPTYTYDDGTTMTINPDGSITTTDTDGNTTVRNPADGPSGPGTGTGGGTGGGTGTGDGIPEIEVVAPRPTLPSPDDDFPPTLGPVVPEPPFNPEQPPTPEPPFNPEQPPTPEPPVVEPPPTTTPPIVPIIPPVTPQPPVDTGPGYTVTWGTPSTLQTNFGLNPGFIQPVAQYQTTSPVQSQYYWGASPFQTGPTFNPQLAAQGIGAPVSPWGLQQMYQQLTPAQTAALVQQQSYLSQLPGAQVLGPVAPT